MWILQANTFGTALGRSVLLQLEPLLWPPERGPLMGPSERRPHVVVVGGWWHKSAL